MSTLGKILLYVALAGAIASVVLGYLVNTKIKEGAAALVTANSQKATAEQKMKVALADAEKAHADQATAEGKLKDATTTAETAKAEMAKIQEQATAAATALNDAKQKATEAQDALDKVKASLGTDTPEGLRTDKKKAEDDLAAALSEKKIMEDQLQKSQQQVADMVENINRSKRGLNKEGVSGKVTFVDRTWNFVVLNVGLQDGVVPNGELIVYRGKTFLGKVRVTKSDPNDSVAEIMPDVKGNIQIGDIVLN